MTRTERFGTRDLTYSRWHRTLADDLPYIDLDAIEYCQGCREALLLIELALDVGQSVKATTVLRKLATRAEVPALLAFYSVENGVVTGFRVRGVAPHYEQRDRLMGPGEFAVRLRQLRDRHTCERVPAISKKAAA
jgi:pyruvate-formate lyase-activating enzyme